MIEPFHDSLTVSVGVVLSESLSIAVGGDSFILPSVGRFKGFYTVVVLIPPSI